MFDYEQCYISYVIMNSWSKRNENFIFAKQFIIWFIFLKVIICFFSSKSTKEQNVYFNMCGVFRKNEASEI